jgi:hypothetical protein
MYDTKALTREYILETYSEQDIYTYYLGHTFKVGDIFQSPLRDDKNPSFGIFKARNGNLLFKDLATGDSGDCFKFVRLKTNKNNFSQVLIDIYIKMFLSKVKPSPSTTISKSKTNITIQKGKWADYDLEYWKQYNISEDILKLYNVYKAYNVYLDNDIVMTHNRLNPIYAYRIFNSYKIYRPKAEKKKKWLYNGSLYDIGGYEQLPETGNILIISKALKDVMLWYSIGYPAICLSSETASIPKSIIDILKGRFKNILICLDNDEPGIKAAEKLSQTHDINYSYIPQSYNEKDLTDYCAKFGIEATEELVKELFINATKKEKKENPIE